MFELKNISKQFHGEYALRDVSLTIGGGLHFLTGPSGSGKTTLLNIMTGMERDFEGQAFYRGQDLKALTGRERCGYYNSVFGFVWQDFNLLEDRTVLENVMLPQLLKELPSEKKVMGLLRELGVAELAHQRAGKLSGGQKQRVAIARALMGDPRIILADEPTGALDRANSTEIMELLRGLAAQRLVVVITHDRRLCSFADEVISIQDGKIVSDRPAPNPPPQCSLRTDGAASPSLGGQAKKNIRVRLWRYLGAALAISIGLMGFLFSLSFDRVIDRSIEKFQEKNTAFNNGYIKGADDGAILDVLLRDERISSAYYQYKLENLTLSAEGRTEWLAEKFPMPKAAESLSYGVMPREGAAEIALTPSLAKKFAGEIQTLLGKTVVLEYGGETCPLTVSGIYNAGYDDFFVSADVERRLYQQLPDGQQNYSISFDVGRFEDIVPVSNNLRLRGIEAKTAADEVSALQNTFQRLNRLFLAISALVLAVGVFLAAVLLFKMQAARCREVGLLSALGYGRGQIAGMLRLENLLLAALAAGLYLILLAASLLLAAGLGYPLLFSPAQALLSLAAAAGLILALGGLASHRLIRIPPAEALRK